MYAVRDFTRFRKELFSDGVLRELLNDCSRSVSVAGDHLIIHHLYL